MNSIRFSSIALCALLLGGPASAQPTGQAHTEALARRAAERLRVLYAEADRLAAQGRTLIGELRRLEVERQIKSEELKKIDAEAAGTAEQLAATDQQVRRLEAQDEAEQPELRSRIVELYKLGRGRYVRLLLSTSDVRRVSQASRMIAALAKRDRDRIATYQRRLEELKTARKTLEERSAELEALRTKAAQAQAAAARAVQARNALIRDIDQRRDLTAQLAGELQAAQQKLQATLRSAAGGAAPVEPASLPIRPFRGDLDWPARGAVRHRFGEAAIARGAASNGIELDAPEDSPVRAVHDGTVAYAGSFEGFGNLVIVDHGSQTFSLYGSLLEVGAAQGTRVGRGDQVGTVGVSPGGAVGLYFELRIDGRPVDPLQWLKRP